MCLYYSLIDHPSYAPKVAEENITCYKILREDAKKEGKYTSPVHSRKKWEIGKTYVNKEERCDFAGAIYGGFYHTYTTKDMAEYFRKKYYPYKSHVVKCIIPKGTIYYVGNVSNTGASGYASRKLKIEEICV